MPTIDVNQLFPFIIIFTNAVTIVLVAFFVKELVKEKSGGLSKKDLKNESYQKALKILDEAKKESLDIYTDSHKKAQEIIQSALKVKNSSKEELDRQYHDLSQHQLEALDKISRDYLKSLRGTLMSEKDKSAEVVTKASGMITKEVMSEIGKMKENLVAKSAEAQKAIDERVGNEVKAVEEELKNYRSERMKSVDDKVVEIISSIAEKVIGRAMSLKDQQDFLMKVLEEEKRKGTLKL